jgi:hypothetical protein
MIKQIIINQLKKEKMKMTPLNQINWLIIIYNKGKMDSSQLGANLY